MILDSIRYKITLVIDNLITNNLDKIEKTVSKKNVELEVNIPVQIDKKNILTYFTRQLDVYCMNNKISMNDISLDGYEITSKTKEVDVYFKSDDINNFSYEPAIMCNLLYTKEVPILRSEQINDTTIKWYFKNNNSVNYLKDKDDNIIAELPLDIDYYIETGLIPGETYTRYITTTNKFSDQLQSMPCSITIVKKQKASIYTKFQVEKRTETIQGIENTKVASRLKAFSSGVGDNDDCMLYKADDTKFSRRFLLYNKIYGVRASNDIKHNTIRFKYRFQLRGVVDYLAYDAKFTVKVTATKCKDYVDEKRNTESNTYGDPMVCEKELTYTLNDNAQVANIYMYQLFPNLLQKDYKQRYEFRIEIKNTSGTARVYSKQYGYHNIIKNNTFTFVEKGYFDHEFTVAGIATKKQKEYIEVYPSEAYDPLVGWVNGDFENTPDGLQNMLDTMNMFETSPSVYDKKYYCIFTEISPDEAYVKYKFNHQLDTEDFTRHNGDGITFYSEAIFADDSEHREFIAQTEEGPYLIDDNRMHKYSYDIKDISVGLSQYKRFELQVVPSINEIVIISAPDTISIGEDGIIDTPVDITCRNLQSAIAKWTPSIHNGYYYYNQQEHFLYSKCAANGKNMILDSIYVRDPVNIKVVMTELDEEVIEQDYDLSLTTKEELLLDSYHYMFEDGKVWPKPVETYNEYYCSYSKYYEYYTSPFIFEQTPTAYTSITWSEAGTPEPSQIEVYGIAYDDVYGSWYAPVRLYNGMPVPSELKLSRVLILKFILKPSRTPKIQTRTKSLCCEADWKGDMLKFLSYNLYFSEEVMMPKSRLSNGVFVSQFIDMGDTSDELKRRSIKFNPRYSGAIEFYIQQANSKVELTEHMKYANWEKVEINSTKDNLKRFIRYMIIIKPKATLYSLDITTKKYEYTGLKKEEYIPGFGDIHITAETRGVKSDDYWEFHHTSECDYANQIHISSTYPVCSVCGHKAETNCATAIFVVGKTKKRIDHEYVMAHELVRDGKKHVLIESIEKFVENIAPAERFDASKIIDVKFYPYNATSNDYNIIKADDIAYIESRDVLTDETLIENNQAGADFNVSDNKIILSPIAQQYAPIIVYCDDDPEPYTQVFFTDSNNKFVLTNTETFESLGFKTVYLKYLNIDLTSIVITIDDVKNKDYTIVNNVIQFDYEIKAGAIINIDYKIKKSFVANYNYENNSMEIQLYKVSRIYTLFAGDSVITGTVLCAAQGDENSGNIFDTYIYKLKVYYETNELSACRQLTNISLNPIYNVRHSGYVYICDYQDEPHSLTINPSDDFIYANGKDTMNILLQVLDKNKNPIENINVNAIAAKGKLKIKNAKTDLNGIIHCRYTSCTENCIDTIKAIVNENVKCEAKIVNRKL